MKVFVDPSCDIQYASFYIYGLHQTYGKKNVTFSSKYFKQFRHNNHFFAFVVKDETSLKKVVIDFTDSRIIDTTALNWCDVYGKINLDDSIKKNNKTIPIGPSFGIQIYSLFETIWYAFTNLIKSYKRIPDKRKFISDYKAQYKRPKYSDYKSVSNNNNYVFFMSSLWKQEAVTNTFRGNFIKSCKANPNVTFEGGFAPRTKNDIKGYEDLTVTSRIPMKVYLKKIINSNFVFNTPAVKSCHGWKLAEYLCLGKAVISTPLSRNLPKELENRKDIFFTNGEEKDVTEKVNEIVMNIPLKQQLESNAKAYFGTYLAPKQVILRLTVH